MKPAVLLVAMLGVALAAPEGHYHQEYNYKASSKSFRNNELQRSTDDQGYYRKDGDLAGREKPVVDANSEHSEYVNPNLRNGQYTGYNANSDMNSYGQMHAEGGGYGGGGAAYGANNYAAEGQSLGQSYGSNAAYGSNYGASSYGSSGYGSSGYYSQNNIQSLAQRIQSDLQRQLQDQIREHNAYSQQRLALDELERQVRHNITESFQNELRNAYGQESFRNGMSYSIVGGKVQTNANYNEQELANLRRNIENSLLNELRTGYNQRSYQESHHDSSSSYVYGSTTVRPTSYQPIYPSLPYVTHTTIRPSVRPYISDGYQGYGGQQTQQIRYTAIPNPESITNILTRIQSDLDASLNRQLDEVYQRYFSTRQAYQLANTDVVLQRLQNELRNNLTQLVSEQIRNNYGPQIERNGYMHSMGTNGQISDQSNYSMRDLENLRATVERHLIQKLTETFQSYRTRVEQSQRFEYSSTPRYEVFTTPRYESYTTPRYVYSSTPYSNYYSSTPNYYSSTPYYYYSTPAASGAIYTKGGGSRYGYAGNSYSGYESSGASAASSSASIAQLQNQVQSEMQREMNAAVSRYLDTAGTSGLNQQAYQASLQQLGDELNRNVTRHLREYSGSASWSATGNYNQGQVDAMKDQLMANLMRQLEQNLQQHYQSSSSSSSSYSYSGGSHANYGQVRPVRENYMGQYRSGGQVMVGEDCVNDDPNSYRAKRDAYGSYGRSYQAPAQKVEDLGQQQVEEEEDLGQQVEDENLEQQAEDLHLARQIEDLGQHIEDLGQEPEDLGQRPEDFGQETVNVGQQVEDVAVPVQSGHYTHHDDGQKVEDDEFGQLEVGQQQIENDNLEGQVQEVEDLEYGHLKPSDASSTKSPHTRIPTDSTQQVIQPTDYNSNKRTEDIVKGAIEQDLSQQLDSVAQKYKELSKTSRTLSQVYIQEISSELERNVTEKLREAYGDGSSTYIQSNRPTSDAEFLALKDKIYKELWETFQRKVERNYQSNSWQSSSTQQVSSNSYGQQRPYQNTYSLNSQSEQLNKRQLRFIKYTRDKLSVTLRESVKEHQINKHLPYYTKTDREIINDINQNVTDNISGYSEHFLKEYLGLSEQQINSITNQLTDELKLQVQNDLNKYSTEIESQQFHSVPQVPAVSWSQHLPNSQYQGQVVEDDFHHIQNDPYPKPSVGNLVKPSQKPDDQNIEQTQFVGQTIDDDDDTQQLENTFFTSGSLHENANQPENERPVVDDDTQQIENEYYAQKPVTNGHQMVGQEIEQGQDYEGQIVEDDFKLPSSTPKSHTPNHLGFYPASTTQKLPNEFYGPLPPKPSQNLQPPPQPQNGYGQFPGVYQQPLTGNNLGYRPPAPSPYVQNTYGQPVYNQQAPVQSGYGQSPVGQWPVDQSLVGQSSQNLQTQSVNQQVDDGQKVEDELYIPPLSSYAPHLPPPPPPSPVMVPPAQYVPYGYTSQQAVLVPTAAQYGYNQPSNNYHAQEPLYLAPQDTQTLINQNTNTFGATQQRQNQFYSRPSTYGGYSPYRGQYDDSQLRQQSEDAFISQSQIPGRTGQKPVHSNDFIQTELNQQQTNLPTLNQVVQEQKQTDQKPETQQKNNVEKLDDVEQIPVRPAGTWVGATEQGQMVTQPQTRQEAERSADQLLESLRAHSQQGRVVSETPLAAQKQGDIDYRFSVVETSSVKPTTTTPKLSYGVQQSLPEEDEIAEIEPLDVAQANVIPPLSPKPVPQTDIYAGVKGRRFSPVEAQTATSVQSSVPNAIAVSNVDVEGNLDTREETTPVVITDENLPWWKRFGNKVKHGAQNLKQKIVG